MRHGPKVAFIRALAKIKDGSHVALDQVSLEIATEVTLTIDRALPVAADGETLPFARAAASGHGAARPGAAGRAHGTRPAWPGRPARVARSARVAPGPGPQAPGPRPGPQAPALRVANYASNNPRQK